MRLDVARRTKALVERSIREVLHEHVVQLANRPPTVRWTKNKPAVPLLSVGIAAGASASDYKVAVRISRHGHRGELLDKMFSKHGDVIDVRYVGRVFPLGTGPIVVTSSGSVSHYLTGTGTIGCPVIDRRTGAESLLSNNHVIGLENDAVPGDAIIDPARDDGGSTPDDAIASFTRAVPIDFSGGPNIVDAAVARLLPGVRIDSPTAGDFHYDPALPPSTVAKSVLVKKVGRTTGLTVGTITGTEMAGFSVDYQNGPARFEQQIEITGIGGPFAAHGDSGALIVNERGAAVALLFAVSETGIAYANPIGPVLTMLDVDLN
ncbi:MAG: hypothetical protein ACK6DW_11030 [Betaproteobacteria bacterium]